MHKDAHANVTTTDDALALAWERVSKKLSTLYGDAIFRSWLKPLRFVGSKDNRVNLSVPTRFMREWVTSHYGEDIRRLWQQENTGDYTLDIIVTQGLAVDGKPTPINNFNVLTPTSWQSEATDSILQMG